MVGNTNEMLKWLMAGRAGSVFGVITCTQPELLAKSRADETPTGVRYPAGVAHITLRTMRIFADYTAQVNNALGREGKEAGFVAKPKWAKKGPDGTLYSPTVQHTKISIMYMDKYDPTNERNGQIYLSVASEQVKTDDTIGSVVAVWKDRWVNLATGEDIEGADLTDLKHNYCKALPHKSGTQGLDHDVQVRDFKVEGICEIHHRGEVFTVTPSPLEVAGIL